MATNRAVNEREYAKIKEVAELYERWSNVYDELYSINEKIKWAPKVMSDESYIKKYLSEHPVLELE